MNFSYRQRLNFSFLGVLRIPNIFREFCFISSLGVSKGCLMISVTFLKVFRQSDVSFSCFLCGYCCGLIDDICLKALSFECANKSKYVWNLQDAKKPFRIKWKVLKRCKPYSNINKKCNLCLYEKFIICDELASSCPHRNR